ncbi:MAG: hypothetical protein KGI69_01480 [Patescibacteria group bacterium]|nr:hypothetical protein [Patescibacteria group bacterium]
MSSDVIGYWQDRPKTRLGREFAGHRRTQEENKLLPPELIMEGVHGRLKKWYEEYRKEITVVFLFGTPRDRRQGEILAEEFRCSRLAHVTAEWPEIERELRAKGPRGGRPDGDSDVEGRFKTHQENALPGIAAFDEKKPGHTLELRRGEMMSQKMRDLLVFALLYRGAPEAVHNVYSRAAQNMFERPASVAYQMIHKLDAESKPVDRDLPVRQWDFLHQHQTQLHATAS